MGRRYRFLVFLAVAIVFGVGILQSATEAEHNAEAEKMLAARMRSLTQSLSGLPKPPAFHQNIQLPELATPDDFVEIAPLNDETKKEKET